MAAPLPERSDAPGGGPSFPAPLSSGAGSAECLPAHPGEQGRKPTLRTQLRPLQSKRSGEGFLFRLLPKPLVATCFPLFE